MKAAILALAVAAALCAAEWSALWLVSTIGEASTSREIEQHKKCRDARIAFFAECLTSRDRTTCEVMWSQVGHSTFDGDPRWPLSNEIDCSASRD